MAMALRRGAPIHQHTAMDHGCREHPCAWVGLIFILAPLEKRVDAAPLASGGAPRWQNPRKYDASALFHRRCLPTLQDTGQ